MASKLTRLSKPITRVVCGDLVVTIREKGVEIRGLRKRVRRKFLTWSQVAALDGDPGSITRAIEQATGKKELESLGVTP